MEEKMDLNHIYLVRNIARPSVLRLIPAIDRAYCERLYNKILRSRNESMVVSAWANLGFEWESVKPACVIIGEFCEWPNCLFFPNDNAGIVFKLGSFHLLDVQTWQTLLFQGFFDEHVTKFDDLLKITLGELFRLNVRQS